MRFFHQQAEARRKSALLYVLFLLALFAIALLANSIAASISLLTGKSDTFDLLGEHSLHLTLGLFFVFVLGSFFKILEIAQGSDAMARHYGAEKVLRQGSSRQSGIVLDIVVEIAIAAQVLPPTVYVIYKEHGINAFVAGYADDDLALVLTVGAIEQLNRDELQALIAHEIAHIKHDDVPLNMRLLIVLGGLMALDQVGKILTTDQPRKAFALFVIVGMVFRLLGYVGVFLGRLIRAAFSRQREFLADAKAIQYCRDSNSLAGALQRISESQEGSQLQGYYADSLAHMCFAASLPSVKVLLATHPTVDQRIEQIDPRFSYNDYLQTRQQPKAAKRQASSVSGTSEGEVSTDIGALFNEGFNGLSDHLILQLSDVLSLHAVVYLLIEGIERHAGSSLQQEILIGKDEQLNTRMQQLLPVLFESVGSQKNQLCTAVLEYVVSQLLEKQNKKQNKMFLAALAKTLKNLPVFEFRYFVIFDILKSKLLPKLSNTATELMRREDAFALLLSLVIEASGHDLALQQARYNKVLKSYSCYSHKLRSMSDQGIISDCERALQSIANQMPAFRRAFIQHVREITMDDQHLTVAEAELLYWLRVRLNVSEDEFHSLNAA